MTLGPAVLAVIFASTLMAQDTVRSAAELRQLALGGPGQVLALAVRQSPVAAREALAELLQLAAKPDAHAPALSASTRLAASMASELGDSFPSRQVARFTAWTMAERREKAAVDSVRRAGNSEFGRSGFAVALPLWHESARRALALGDTAGAAAATGNIGAGWYAEGALDSAAVYFERAGELARASTDQRTALNALGGLANVKRDRGDLAGAIALYDETSRLRERIGDERGLIADLVNRGVLAEALGDLRGAQAAYARALERSLHFRLAEPAATARVNLGQLAVLRGGFDEAERHYAGALATYRELRLRPDEALVLRHLGLMEMRRGDYARARTRLAEALGIYRNTGPLAAQVGTLSDLAALGVATGNPEDARRRVEEASIVASGAADGVLLRAEVALARGDLEAAFNRQAQSERAYRSAESLFLRAGDAGGLAQARAGRGYLLLLDDDVAAATPLLEQAARSQDEQGDVRAAALTRLDLAAAHATAGRAGTARALAETARDTLARLGDAPGEAAAMGVLAQLELDASRPARAEALYRDALARLGGASAVAVRWPLQLGLSRALEGVGARAAARGVLTHAIELAEQGAGNLTLDQRSSWFADKWELHVALARLDAAAGRDSAAFAASERLRANDLRQQLVHGRVAWRAGRDSALVRQEQDLRQAITDLAGTLDGSPISGVRLRGSGSTSASMAAREALAEAEERYADLLEHVRERQPAWAAAVRPTEIPWRTAAALLPTDAALLEYLVADSSVMLFVVRPGGIRTLTVDANRRTLSSLVDFVRGTMSHTPRAGTHDPGPAALERLHRLLIEPAESAGLLDEVRRLLIIPHAELHYLPFAALRAPGPNGSYLIQRYELAQAASASTWVEVEARPAAAGRGVLAMAPASTQLPGTIREVRAVQAAHGATTQVLIGRRAVKRELLAGARDVGIVHLAGYGVLNRRNPLFSYLELAPAGREDGRLEVHEVFGLGLDATLVVLSACQTGVGSGLLGDVPAGDEWVSLSRAFLTAGARRVVASLWLVEDQATAELMGGFHRELARGEPVSSALATAQRSLLQGQVHAHPFYWAGFTVVGGF